jgi:hypothetical protein
MQAMGTAGAYFGWLEASSLSQAMRGSLWMYPIVEIVHIVGFVILVGSVAMFDLRVLGLSKGLPVERLGRHLLRWSVASLALTVPAGLMMFSAHPQDFIGNRIFLLKMLLIMTAAVNAAMFHIGPYRTVDQWDAQVRAPISAKLHAAFSLLIWIAVISCGRLLAYT